MSPKNLFMILSLPILASCGDKLAIESDRWYTSEQVVQGEKLFQAYCAVCHGARAEGTKNWKKRDAAGNLPPPPLNGSAHAWHHPMEVLMETITNGGSQWQGTMPGFKAQLNDEEKRAVIAYFQSLWSKEIYHRWEGLNQG